MTNTGQTNSTGTGTATTATTSGTAHSSTHHNDGALKFEQKYGKYDVHGVVNSFLSDISNNNNNYNYNQYIREKEKEREREKERREREKEKSTKGAVIFIPYSAITNYHTINNQSDYLPCCKSCFYFCC